MKLKELENLLLTNPFFKTSNLYEDYDGEDNEVFKQTAKDFEHGGIKIEVNFSLVKDEYCYIELNLAELEGDLEEFEYKESVQDFVIDPSINPKLKEFLALNTGISFDELTFNTPDAVTPEEGIVEIVLKFENE